MLRKPQRLFIPAIVWLAISTLGGVAIARLELNRLRDEFETNARIAHRLLSQRAVQHDAVMAMLALIQPAPEASQPEQRLPSVYPQIIGVQRRDRDTAWADERLAAAEIVSHALKRPVLAVTDFARGRYQLVLAAEPTSFSLQLDLRSVVPWSEWPMAPDNSPVRVTLVQDKQGYVLQPGRIREGGWRFEFHKHLATDSQPFDVVGIRQVGWKELPWAWMAAWALLANTQAASRLLAEDPPDLAIVRWIRHALASDAEITERIVGAEEGQALNRDYRQKDYATNVLTFDYTQEPMVTADLVLCAPVVAEEAATNKKRFRHITRTCWCMASCMHKAMTMKPASKTLRKWRRWKPGCWRDWVLKTRIDATLFFTSTHKTT